MSNAQNKALVRHVLEEEWRGNFNLLREHPGLHEAIPFLSELHAAVDFSSREIMEQLAEGDWVVTRLLNTGTTAKDFMGTPAGIPMKMEVILMQKVQDGKIVESHGQGGQVR